MGTPSGGLLLIKRTAIPAVVFKGEKQWKINNAHKLINNVRTSKNAIRTINNSLSASVKTQEDKTAKNGPSKS